MKIQRIQEIENYLRENNSASIKKLCEIFDVSLNTIRRDIDELHKRGIISKVYGGITINKDEHIVPYSQRTITNKRKKEVICRLASTLLTPGSTVYLDSGTTPISILKYIKPEMKIVILSNSLSVFNEATKYNDLNVIALGGLLANKTNSFIGVSAIEQLSNYRINLALMSTTSVNIEYGATNNSYYESEMKKAIIKQSKKIALLCDSTKLDTYASLSFSPLEEFDTFVVDKKPDKKYVDFFSENNISLLYPENEK